MKIGQLISVGENAEVYRDGNRAVKLFNENFPKTKVLYEALTHSRVEATEISIPKLYEVCVIEGRWAIVTEYIEGISYADLMIKAPNKINEYLDDLVELQIEIQCTPAPKLSKLKDKLERLINEIPELDEIRKYELLTRLEGMPVHNKLCHCNYVPENVIVNDNGVYILDWKNARQGNASADVANSYLMLSLKSPEEAETYLNLFCEKTCTPKAYVQQWMPIVAAARFKHGNLDEKETLLKWIDVVAYE